MARSNFNAGHVLPHVLVQLAASQTKGKFQRILNSFKSKRKIIVSLLASLLALVWLGQTILAMLLREPANPESLQTWLSVSLLSYCLFHAIKIACRQPIEPYEWNAAERQILIPSPLKRHQLVSYRFVSYFGATFAKATCFSIVMIPDLPNFLVGFAAMFVGLTIVDLIRILLELAAWASFKTSKRVWTLFRSIMLAPALAIFGLAFYAMTLSPNFQEAMRSTNPLSIPQLFLAALGDVTDGPMISFFMIPWRCVAGSVVGGFSLTSMLNLISLSLLAGVLITAVYTIDEFSQRLQRGLAKTGCRKDELKTQRKLKSPRSQKPPVGFGGAKAIAWYQLRGAIHYRSTIAFSLSIPAFLSCAPLLSGDNSALTGLGVIGSIVFYSFLLLPPALMLDFRRDARRLTVWKASPITAKSLTLGQLAIPVLLMSVFQIVVLMVSVLWAGLSWKMLFSLPVLIPMNFLIIGMENAIFLIQPHRRNQEGIEVFLRTILVFTGKGILFAVGLGLTLAWAWICLAASSSLGLSQVSGQLIFLAGAAIALSAVAWMSVEVCTRLFMRLDVSQDLPAR